MIYKYFFKSIIFYLFFLLFIEAKKSELSSLISLLSPNFKTTECDLITDGPICLFNAEKIILPQARHKNLMGYWNFEEVKPLDFSGLRNHGLNIVKAGPAFGSLGHSGYFSNGEFLEIPHTKAFESPNFTITFWVFIIQDFFSASKGLRFCPLFQKGKDDLLVKTFSRFPSIYYDRQDKNFKVSIKTKSQQADQAEGESFTSFSKLNTQKWMHVALTKSDKEVKLYLNGIFDKSITLKDEPELNSENIFVGGTPWLKEECNYPLLIDELRYYNDEIEESLIAAEAAPALGAIGPNDINLGCVECSLKRAATVCKEGYKLCTPVDLHAGVYQVARSMGWLNWNTHIWTYSALSSPKNFEKFKGLAICCIENK